MDGLIGAPESPVVHRWGVVRRGYGDGRESGRRVLGVRDGALSTGGPPLEILLAGAFRFLDGCRELGLDLVDSVRRGTSVHRVPSIECCREESRLRFCLSGS